MRSAVRAVGRSGWAPRPKAWSAPWSAWSGRSGSDGPDDPDERWLTAVLHIAFFLLLGSSLIRYLIRDTGSVPNGWVVALFVAFGALYLPGRWPAPAPSPGGRPSGRYLLWLTAVLAAWVALLVLAPSAAWCAMPLFFTGLHTLPTRFAVPLAAVLTALVVASKLRFMHDGFDPNALIAPPAIAAVAAAVLIHLRRQSARQRVLIDDLVRTRRDLAATERRAGILAERQRLSSEIHDTLAQGLSSQRMLLQAADRTWETDPQAARGHMRNAAEIASRSLTEARRFVQDLAPADLAEGSLAQALGALAERESDAGSAVDFRLDGPPGPLPERVEAALLRIAQGALANVREHAGASRAALTLTCLGDQICLDIADDGRGFDTDAVPAPGADRSRGHGLPAMRARVRQLGGTLTVESVPGEGTVVSAAIPVEPLPASVPDRPVEATP
ncbi:sensor histidine kinase [Streptomyces rapamycinicus]|uniref:Oxygen sensor histidine kinase NreB n=2 Tax=Streptomyces rapamycinicus TaxID=1226757 RepID=A0A0A0NVK9_STRRN|nr:nickel transporter [Streptomyces rapamycinicus NRRL 5491]MBB4788071.1 signal transduction histidine kinase [Streptomyces rapamycinicus]RLV72407.1 nickel transporter [Streptomyces rapamycinicus NRRL 5491]